MDYLRIYNEIIERGVKRSWSKGESDGHKIEMHHIIPKCMGGTDEPGNLVALTVREQQKKVSRQVI
ncbi:homing endonuclease [Acinetobacter phage Acj9]|uniref:Putative truncated Mob-like homing endonuclease n=1 Tax=Acinetobacter phage Acj9 TaxID=760939 RepID=E5EPX4_9CAUD|nr:homing endonuclease [Acinetobacter phage Acj9]ADG60090.1 putative truncated Mob-like homing endonuclease [Acinetobacter phage Acj9]